MTKTCIFCNEPADEVCCVSCIRLPREQQFLQLLNKLEQATRKANPHDALVTTVKQIQRVSFLTENLTYIPRKRFNSSTHHIDKIAQTYLFQCQ